MKSWITVKEAAESWNITERRVTKYLTEGRIEGAVKEGRRWLIPIYAEKPEALTYFSESPLERKGMVMGTDNYIKAVTENFYVDKTLLIKEILKDPATVILFTRPRRFGKSLNMDMLRVFFEKTDKDTSKYFSSMAIWREGTAIRREQGKHPVIFLTFKDSKYTTWALTLEDIKETIAAEYERHPELRNSKALTAEERNFYEKTVRKKLSEVELRWSIYNLSKMLYEEHGEEVIILMDEYDTPIAYGRRNGFYDEILDLMRELLSKALKTTPYLKKGVITGILRIAKESLFSGLNNLRVDTVLDEKYSRFFGFTNEEVEKALRYYSREWDKDELELWYDGYIFGKEHIYNPWSVACWLNNNGKSDTYWVNTGENPLLRELLRKAESNIYRTLLSLLEKKKIDALIDTTASYERSESTLSQIFSLLVVSGYLRAEDAVTVPTGEKAASLSIPNREVETVWCSEVLFHMKESWKTGDMSRLQLAVITKDRDTLKEELNDFLMNSVSFFDTANESFYHGLMLGLVALLPGWSVRSNRESGLGRYDIMLAPDETDMPGIIIEVNYPDLSTASCVLRFGASVIE